MEFINMTCRNCGGKLQFSKEAEQIICQFCNSEYLISYNQGTISIKLLVEGVKKIQESTDKTASELALERLRKEKLQIEQELFEYLIEIRWMKRNEKLYPLNEIYLYYKTQLDKEQNAKFFRDTEKINKLNFIVSRLSQYQTRLSQIERDEVHHLKIVKSS